MGSAKAKSVENEIFTAPVVYSQPTHTALKRRFIVVSSQYDGLKFDPIDRCKDVSRESREVTFEYVHLNRFASTDEVLAEMDRKGLRPALYEELIAFAEKYPDEQRTHPVVALGSMAYAGDYRSVAFLWSGLYGFNGRELGLYWIDSGSHWHGSYRFLAVPK